jgi:hypothetical protein
MRTRKDRLDFAVYYPVEASSMFHYQPDHPAITRTRSDSDDYWVYFDSMHGEGWIVSDDGKRRSALMGRADLDKAISFIEGEIL